MRRRQSHGSGCGCHNQISGLIDGDSSRSGKANSYSPWISAWFDFEIVFEPIMICTIDDIDVLVEIRISYAAVVRNVRPPLLWVRAGKVVGGSGKQPFRHRYGRERALKEH